MITTLFITSGAAIGGMIGLRMLEMKYERCIGLAHLSMRADRRIKPYAKRFGRYVADKREAAAARLKALPGEAKQALMERFQNARIVGDRYYEFLAGSVRGKRMLQGGSVSFFLLNITNYDSKWKKRALHDGPVPAPVRIPVEDRDDAHRVAIR